MTISRAAWLAALLVLAQGAWADTPAAASATASSTGFSYPKTLTWALGEFQGEGEWTIRLPLLLVRGWDTLPDHLLTGAERDGLRAQWKDDALRSVRQQESTLRLGSDRKKLAGTQALTDPETTKKSLSDLDKKASLAQGLMDPDNEPPLALPLKAVWEKDQINRPWVVLDAHDLIIRAKAAFAVTGTVRLVGGYLDVAARLTSGLENRTVATWEGRFAPEEAPARMEEASQQFHEALLGRPWAGLAADSPVQGARIRVDGRWHNLPWLTDNLVPGPTVVRIELPGRSPETKTFDLAAGSRLTLTLPAGTESPRRLVLETDPPGALLYLDSMYLGPSPQTIDAPLAVSRVRAELPGWASQAWEVGPTTASPSFRALSRPQPKPSVEDAKDKFYFSLAVFSFSLTSTAFMGAWVNEQVQLTNAYAVAGDQKGYDTAYSRYRMVSNGYAAGVVLTSGLFVWMMFELGDYLTAAQAGLP